MRALSAIAGFIGEPFDDDYGRGGCFRSEERARECNPAQRALTFEQP